MLPSFLLFHVENINDNRDSVCHIVLIPVIDGVKQDTQEFFFNPEAKYQMVMSGITAEQVSSFEKYSTQWPAIQSIFDKYDMAVCSAEGYSAHALYGTLERLGIVYKPIKYCNAKAICRRTMDEVSYSFDYLNFKIYGDCIYEDDPVSTAIRWGDLALKGLETANDTSWDEFLAQAKINPGVIEHGNFIPSLCIRDYSKRAQTAFDQSTVSVDAQPDNPFYGMNVVFTGKLESMKRDDARAAVIRIGGLAPERLTQETDYLVVGIQDLRVVGEKGLSGKMKTAAKYKEKVMPIEIIDEQDFIDMIGKENIPQKPFYSFY